MMRWLNALLSRPRVVIAVATLVSALAALTIVLNREEGAPLLRVDASFEALVPGDSAEGRVMDRLEQYFGVSEPLLAIVHAEPLFEAETLRAIEDAHARIAQLEGVRSVTSLASAPNLLFNAPDDPTLDVGSVTQQLARNADKLERVRQSAARNPMLAGILFNAETHTAAFVITPGSVEADGQTSDADVVALARKVTEILQETPGLDGPAVTGNTLISAATSEAVWTGLIRTLPVAVILVVGLLALSFRSTLVVVLGSMSIGVSLLVMWAVGSLAGLSLNMVTAIAPPVVVAFGIMFSIHMVSEWMRHSVGEDTTLARRAVGAVAVPLLLNGLTTSIGLAALALSPLPAVREFSLLTVTGVVSLTILSVSYLPALLLLMGSHIGQDTLPGERIANMAARGLAWFDIRWRRHLVVLGGLVVVIGLVMAQRVEPGSAYVENFARDAPVRVDYDRINHQLGGAATIAVLLETPLDHVLLDPGVATAVDDFVQWARAQPEIGGVASYVDHVKVLNAAMQAEVDGELVYPDSARLARQLVNFGGTDAVRGLIDPRQRHARLTVRITVDHSSRIRDLAQRMEAKLAALPPAVQASVTGTPVMAAYTVDRIVDRQWLSVGAALVAIFLVLLALFLSMRAALIAMLPNLLPVSVYFGLLGITGIGLNPATSLVACLVIGVAVDDTIHFLARFNAEARARGSEGAAVSHALRTILRPVTLTTAALCLSFGVFALSPLSSHTEFGLLAALALFVAWLTDIFITPALGSMVRIVTLWDLLRVDLGQSPQYTVPLLTGLSNRQARLFALTARYEKVLAGTDIMREGEVSADICVVVDGQLEVWVDRNGQRKILNCLFRGATLGEAGYFGQKRTATVTAKCETRILRFDANDLERLRRRHPRIAALVLRNLNRIQAERLAHATAMLR